MRFRKRLTVGSVRAEGQSGMELRLPERMWGKEKTEIETVD